MVALRSAVRSWARAAEAAAEDEEDGDADEVMRRTPGWARRARSDVGS